MIGGCAGIPSLSGAAGAELVKCRFARCRLARSSALLSSGVQSGSVGAHRLQSLCYTNDD